MSLETAAISVVQIPFARKDAYSNNSHERVRYSINERGVSSTEPKVHDIYLAPLPVTLEARIGIVETILDQHRELRRKLEDPYELELHNSLPPQVIEERNLYIARFYAEVDESRFMSNLDDFREQRMELERQIKEKQRHEIGTRIQARRSYRIRELKYELGDEYEQQMREVYTTEQLAQRDWAMGESRAGKLAAIKEDRAEQRNLLKQVAVKRKDEAKTSELAEIIYEYRTIKTFLGDEEERRLNEAYSPEERARQDYFEALDSRRSGTDQEKRIKIEKDLEPLREAYKKSQNQ